LLQIAATLLLYKARFEKADKNPCAPQETDVTFSPAREKVTKKARFRSHCVAATKAHKKGHF
jgi:hypothetical protein